MTTRLFHRYAILAASFIFIITAYCSRGFHHFDEHFQILEFAGLKLGMNHEKDLAWEYNAKMRPAIQPAITVVAIKTMQAVGVVSPFIWATVIRIMTACFLLFCIYRLTSALLPFIDAEHHKLFILLSYFLYIIPYISVRFSSETVSSGFFLLGLSILIAHGKPPPDVRYRNLIIMGLLFGLSFICRFQSGILITGVLVWLFFVYRISWTGLLIIILGIITITGVGILIDHWFYGQWVLTPWRYFREDVLATATDRFGSSPWYYYLAALFTGDAKSVLKLLLLIGSIYFLFSNSRDVVAFAVVPFVLVHFMIAHKEMRFLIPIAFFAPYIAVLSWQYIRRLTESRLTRQVLQLILFQALFINGLSLLANMLKPADGQPLVYEYIYEHHGNKATDIYYLDHGGNFFWSQGLLPMYFYNQSHAEPHAVAENDISGIAAHATSRDALLIAHRSIDLSDRPVKRLYSTKPEWLQRFDFNDWMKIKNDDWVVYQILPSKLSER